ncbi:MAG TPA: FAD:protein FMN transferase [Candidatus Cryosericum sp.]|nr:FAD:protein FMN transferase [Candidatus Cryosericum sp.]
MKKVIAAVLAVVVLSMGTIALIRGRNTPEPVTSTYFLMDTVLTIKTTGGDAAAINDHLHELALQVDAMTSYYETGSETTHLNASAGTGPIPVSDEYANLLRTALSVELTGGEKTFDICISPVSSLWGFTTKEFRVPSPGEIASVLPYSQPDQLVVSGTSAELKDPRARIDLGGIAKGYSLDVMEAYLRTVSPQPSQVIVDFGGNLLLYSAGRKTDWKVGIRDPRGDGIIGYVVSGDAFVATSGDYQRYFEKDGTRYCHIIDPSTGYPARLNQSATVITSLDAMHGAMGDALGKVFFCSDAAHQQELYAETSKQGVVGVVLVDAGGARSTLGPITLVSTGDQ